MAEQFNSLVDAKKEFIHALAKWMAPHVLHAFRRQYDHVKGDVAAFRAKLRGVKQWNATQIKDQTNAIMQRCPYFKWLVTSAFVTSVKIMSTVRIRQEKPNINLRLPAEELFVHKVFIEAAKAFYYNPALIVARDSMAKFEAVRHAVQTAVRDLLPFQDILIAYLGDVVDPSGHEMRATDLGVTEVVEEPREAQAEQQDEPPQPSAEQPVAPAPAVAPATAEQLQRVKDMIATPVAAAVVAAASPQPVVASPVVAASPQPAAAAQAAVPVAVVTMPLQPHAPHASPVKTIKVPGAFVTPESPGLFGDAGDF